MASHHFSEGDVLSHHPTIEEIIIGQAAVLKVIGKKGSDQRKEINGLCRDSMLDLEECLGSLLLAVLLWWYPRIVLGSVVASGAGVIAASDLVQ